MSILFYVTFLSIHIPPSPGEYATRNIQSKQDKILLQNNANPLVEFQTVRIDLGSTPATKVTGPSSKLSS